MVSCHALARAVTLRCLGSWYPVHVIPPKDLLLSHVVQDGHDARAGALQPLDVRRSDVRLAVGGGLARLWVACQGVVKDTLNSVWLLTPTLIPQELARGPVHEPAEGVGVRESISSQQVEVLGKAQKWRYA